jgi:hypothetical protein
LFAEYFWARLLELQTLGQSDPSATCTPSCWDGDQQLTGPLPPLLSFAVEHRTNTFEIYSTDLLLALDPNYPGYGEYHEQYQHALSAVHFGRGSTVTISPASLQFGTVPVGDSSASQTITLTNSGTFALTIHRVRTSGRYSETDDCVSQTIAPGAQCTISLVFIPTATGTQGGLLWIYDTDRWSPQSVGLTGTGE